MDTWGFVMTEAHKQALFRYIAYPIPKDYRKGVRYRGLKEKEESIILLPVTDQKRTVFLHNFRQALLMI